ncbi:MAG: cupin [Spirulinaceae cyanobacterium]
MKGDWLVQENGICAPCKRVRDWDLVAAEYRLYRFLTEVEDALRLAADSNRGEVSLLSTLRPLTRKLILNCYTIQTRLPEPNPKTGIAIVSLYDELGLPLTLQTESHLPQTTSPIHNHGTWGIIAVLTGQQKNTFWRRNPVRDRPDRIEYVDEKIIYPGEIISFTTEAIHSIEALGDEPTVTLNLYGETQGQKRFMFDRDRQTAKRF